MTVASTTIVSCMSLRLPAQETLFISASVVIRNSAKFGMFVDWGPWSVAGWAPQAEKATYPDWYEYRLFKEFRDYHLKTWGADIGPDDLIQLLRGDAFQPSQLVSLARQSGMRYVVPFLKHHGGYALWDSSYTHRDSLEWGLERDIAGEFVFEAHQLEIRRKACEASVRADDGREDLKPGPVRSTRGGR